jgi:eukaryotic-like serine/threonine-protein kinase
VSNTPPALTQSLRERLQREIGDSYEIIRELGGGGSAHVFLATEVALQRQVVLKVLPSELTDGVDGARFQREIAIAARLQHPHLVPLLSAGEPDLAGAKPELNSRTALRWYTMPFVEGWTLREHIDKRAPAPLPEAVRLLRELSSALSYAHAKGVIHRDIKPENILLSDGVAMIADFGVAKALDDASAEALSSGRRVTTVSMALGTPAYMAPEQVRNSGVVDHKADLYAFACVAYELLTGAPPFVRTSLRATMQAQLCEAPRPLQQQRPDVPSALADVLMRCLEKDPLQRPHSASVVIRMLDALTVQPASRVATPASPVTAVAPEATSAWRTILRAVALLLLAATGWWLVRG